ncbi:hypothetical protein Zm00014a_041320 [Zea mays]|uniref:Uncharacterized protein n=1 Tax=Zea mays TaxID=4577 RepID=A0A3L6E694_MAIZE|nr:hypothetical protein Zm00014a_041320 [Zea mays]
MDLENADLRMMRVMEAYQVKEFHPDVCKDPEIADLRMSERWRSIRFKQVKDGLLSAVSEMQYCAREMRKIVDSLWTMNLNEVSSRLQEMAMFLEGAVDRGHMAAEELSPPRLNF